MAVGAAGKDRLSQGAAVSLAGHFHEAKFAHPKNGAFRRVVFHAIFELVEDASLVFAQAHVDEVADDQAADIAQAELAGDFFGSFQIDADEGFFHIGFASASCVRS